MANQASKSVIASSIGIAFSGAFVGFNLGMSYIAIPCLLLPPSPASLPEPATSTNDKSPSTTSKPKPVTSSGHLARQWKQLYDLGVVAGPGTAFIGVASYIAGYYLLPAATKTQQKLLIAAAAINLSILPYTFGAMMKTNYEIARRAKAASNEEEEVVEEKSNENSVEKYQTSELVSWWGTLNVLRALIPLGGIACTIAALTE